MEYVESPQEYPFDSGNRSPAIFLAGGISNCSNWQHQVVKDLQGVIDQIKNDLVLLNPRRKNFNISNPALEQQQIEWEHRHISKADAHIFWFCEETLCPIALFELGKVMGYNKPLFVGTHPNYKRKRDVSIQLLLTRPEVDVVQCLDAVIGQVVNWAKQPFLRESFAPFYQPHNQA